LNNKVHDCNKTQIKYKYVMVTKVRSPSKNKPKLGKHGDNLFQHKLECCAGTKCKLKMAPMPVANHHWMVDCYRDDLGDSLHCTLILC